MWSAKQALKRWLPASWISMLRRAESHLSRWTPGAVLLWARRAVDGWRLKRIHASIVRVKVDRCWCGGELAETQFHPRFGICRRCGCFVGRFPPDRSEMARLYAPDCYWGLTARVRGWPGLKQRADLYRRDGRLDHWLNLFEKYGPASGTVIEIGCAPGALLIELRKRGFECVGVEPNVRVARWVQKQTGVPVKAGLFPDDDLDLPACDAFLAFDVLEHVHAPDRFFRKAAELLRDGGVMIIQAPTDRYGPEMSLAARAPAMFDDLEHLYIFVDGALKELAARAGLEVVSMSEAPWNVGHEISIFRKPAARERHVIPS